VIIGRGVLLLEGEMVMLEKSRSCNESVEMCWAEGVSYDCEVSKVLCVMVWVSSANVVSVFPKCDCCSS